MFVLPLLVLFVLGGVGVLCGEVRINTADELVEFSNNVNKGTNYLGTAVFLESDIDLSGKTFELIGNNSSNGFRGTFDGQGHTISNLVINSSSQYVGLFGYSKGTTIKNVVMDSSCSVTGSYESASGAYIGGIIGYCQPNSNMYVIENVVNMGSVTFKGNASGQSSCLGGITGSISSTSSSHEANITNCVNYGSVSHAGSSVSLYIGGIIGYSKGASTIKPIFIQNCLNYGVLSSNYKVSNAQYIGGIAGRTGTAMLENCVSSGKIISGVTTEGYDGGIAGNVQLNTAITHCIWTSNVGYDKVSGTGTPTITDLYLIGTLNATTINELNEYAEKNSTWSRWVILHLNGGSISDLDQSAPVAGLLKSLPVPVKEGNEFLFWCIDEGCNEKYDPDKAYSSGVTGLYAFWTDSYFITFNFNNGTKVSAELSYDETIVYPEDMKREGHAFKGWSPKPARMPAKNITVTAQWTINSYTVVFNFNNGTIKNIEFKYNETIAYPVDMKREGYTFGWDPNPARMPAGNITVTAQWIINSYTVTFNFNNGTTESIEFKFNEAIAYPANMKREGHAFKGWSPKPVRMPAENITVWAQWNEVSEYVEIVFSTKDLNEEKAKEIVEKYTGAEFTIAKFVSDENEVKVIIKFNDVEEATNFIEAVSSSSDVKKRVIKNVGFIRDLNSFSSPLNLFVFTYFLF